MPFWAELYYRCGESCELDAWVTLLLDGKKYVTRVILRWEACKVISSKGVRVVCPGSRGSLQDLEMFPGINGFLFSSLRGWLCVFIWIILSMVTPIWRVGPKGPFFSYWPNSCGTNNRSWVDNPALLNPFPNFPLVEAYTASESIVDGDFTLRDHFVYGFRGYFKNFGQLFHGQHDPPRRCLRRGLPILSRCPPGYTV